MAIIRIDGLQVETVIGVYDWERELPQQLTVSMELTTDIADAVASDNVKDAVDYERLTNRIMEWTESQQFKLVEGLAMGILKLVMQHPRVTHATVMVSKPGALADAQMVEVEVDSDDDM